MDGEHASIWTWLGLAISVVVAVVVGSGLAEAIRAGSPTRVGEVVEILVAVAVLAVFLVVGWTYLLHILGRAPEKDGDGSSRP